MKKILFITSTSLDNLRRGTPIRMFHLVDQLRREYTVEVYTLDQKASFWSIYNSLTKRVELFKPDLVITATETDAVWPCLIKLRYGLPIAIDLHGLSSVEMYFNGHMGRFKSWLFQQKVNFLLWWYDLAVVVSPQLRDFYKNILKQTLVFCGGVSEQDFVKTAPFEDGDFVIGYAGNCNLYQGLDQVLEVAHRLKKQGNISFRLNLILSNGRGEIEDKLKQLGLFEISDLHFKVPHEEVPSLISRSHVLIASRPDFTPNKYSFPSKLPEYLATGIPVIATKVGPVAAVFSVCDGECLLLIPPQDFEDDLEVTITKLYNLSTEERRAFGRRGCQFVREHLMWNVLGDIINPNIQKLLENKPRQEMM